MSCSFEVMPRTLRIFYVCLYQASRQELSAAILARPQCLGVSWTVLCAGGSGSGVRGDFRWVVPGVCVEGGKAAFLFFLLG